MRDIWQKNSFWTNQAYHLLYVFKQDENDFTRIMKMLMSRVKDRHNRFVLMDHFKGSAARIMTAIKNQMG